MPFRRGGFRKFGPRVDIPKPVKVGEEYDVEINEVGSRGDGIARIKNFVVFIAGAKQGEKTRIKITEVRNRFAMGEKVSGKAEAEEAEVSEEKPVEAEEPEEEE
jgi:predicted RNA-binding protein with TRAM domain